MSSERSQRFHVAVLAGDGIGPEVIAEGIKVLQAVESELAGVCFQLTELPAGAGEYLRSGEALKEEIFLQCLESDAILLGAMGLPDVRGPGGAEITPQLDLRERLDLYCGLRPVRLFHPAHTPLKSERALKIDLLIVRENTEGLFSSRKQTLGSRPRKVKDTLLISRKSSERLFQAAFEQARRRRRKLTLVDKSNVLPSMVFFRKIFEEVSCHFPDVQTEKIYIDAASLYLIQRPWDFDVLVTENMFGDILSDLTAGLAGGMGMAPSGDVGDSHAVFQPAHGSAPDIAGRGIANPTATILSVAMMLEWLGHPETVRGARLIENAVERVLGEEEKSTPDLGGSCTTRELGEAIASALNS